ncbi:MAG: ribosome biogenesis GTPase Der [Nitrospiraceae bacterium]|nr:ribosome biogenesis GTPase Der [Nitrospiraceae bacterium]
MAKPLIAIIGRPNVGKSTLFNRMTGGRHAIVEAIEGVTRDRNYAGGQWDDRQFIVVDTGGFYPESEEPIYSEVKDQALFAAEEADLIIHLMDGRDGLTPADQSIAGMLRVSGRKAVCLPVVNKVDAPSKEVLMYDFYRLGAGEIIPVSAATGFGFDELMEKIMELLPEAGPEKEEQMPRVAVVGRPNAGKSTLINALLDKKRLVVSPVAGTTRDAIDTVCTYYGKKYLFIDTAGIKKKSKAYPLEHFSMIRALRSIERCDVAVIVIDASAGIVTEDQKIAGLVHGYGKGAVFLFNKWDLVPNPDEAFKTLSGELARKMWFFSHAPFLTTSGAEKRRITKIFPLVDSVLSERGKTVPRAELMEMLSESMENAHLPVYRGKRVRVYSMNQVGKNPPVFAIYSNEPAGIKDIHLKYFEKRLRERFSFAGTPVKIIKKRKK